jgi:hypothetical protein
MPTLTDLPREIIHEIVGDMFEDDAGYGSLSLGKILELRVVCSRFPRPETLCTPWRYVSNAVQQSFLMTSPHAGFFSALLGS